MNENLSPFLVFDSGQNDAQKNMDLDLELLRELSDQPILHFYDWTMPCATYGYFIKPEEFFYLEVANQKRFQLARRPTGGGIIFHTSDFAFSILIPTTHPAYSLNTLSSYAYINSRVSQVIESYFSSQNTLHIPPESDDPSNIYKKFCMAHPTQYDIMIGGRKVGGASQRKTKQGILHQGSIALGVTDQNLLEEILKEGIAISKEMKNQTYPLLGHHCSRKELREAKETLKHGMSECLKKSFTPCAC